MLERDKGRYRPVVRDWGNGKTQSRIRGPVSRVVRGTLDYCAPNSSRRGRAVNSLMLIR